jgi:hypothetical protein
MEVLWLLPFRLNLVHRAPAFLSPAPPRSTVNTLTIVAYMEFPRWYPSANMLPDGEHAPVTLASLVDRHIPRRALYCVVAGVAAGRIEPATVRSARTLTMSAPYRQLAGLWRAPQAASS